VRPALRIVVTTRDDADEARREARAAAIQLGFGQSVAEMIALVATELASNLVRYAHVGEIRLSTVHGPRGVGLQVESRDRGPGIDDLERAMLDGYSTGGGLGSGLPGVRRLMDEFEIDSGPDGTTIVARKWTGGP
jgi:serine/threonine-protein kinase RsbT